MTTAANIVRPEAAESSPATRPRILIVASTLHTGGAERVMADLARYLDKHRFDVSVVFLKENGVIGAEIAEHGTAVIPVPGLVAGKIDRWTWWKLRKLILGGRYDLLHTHDPHGFMDAALCRLTVRRTKHIHTFHWGNYPYREARLRIPEHVLWRVPDRLVAVGHRQASALRALYSIPESRIEVIWNGVPPPRPQVAGEVLDAIRDAQAPVILSVSTLIEQKGLHHLLTAARLLKERHVSYLLLIAGHGPLRETLERQCEEMGLTDRVRFLGWVTQAANRAIPACDIFVQSSLWEGMSVAVLEAMANGKPVVATRVGDNDRVIEDGISGRLVDTNDPEALAAALGKLISSKEARDRIGAAAQDRYRQQFTVDHMIRAHELLYERVLAS